MSTRTHLTRATLAVVATAALAALTSPTVPAHAEDRSTAAPTATRVASYDDGSPSPSLDRLERQSVSIATLTDVDPAQAREIRRDSDWGFYQLDAGTPTARGAAVTWRKQTWALVNAREVEVPVGDQPHRLLLAQLKNRHTGKVVSVLGTDGLSAAPAIRDRVADLRTEGLSSLLVTGSSTTTVPESIR
ncbi:hypothetical protein [Luteipulveratus halotolerans]|uniref:Uncharacterized protein n=1 Tax=Luteipulveratus halotolerans TaxID=1631356 RepID=A0A0L6CL77_9MICO|nr:hypothetical protein [Luteipulveratus halotolerans]KNX38512.1 hypothetical protein VV01_17345 [Luteipulveratus halotolerans]